MNVSHVRLQVALKCTDLRAKVALKSLDVTDSVYYAHVPTHAVCFCELPAANLTRVLGVRMLWSWRRRRSGVARSVRRVVVSADR